MMTSETNHTFFLFTNKCTMPEVVTKRIHGLENGVISSKNSSFTLTLGQNHFFVRSAAALYSESVFGILEPLPSACRFWRRDGQAIRAGHDGTDKRGAVPWRTAARIPAEKDGRVSLCTPWIIL